MSGAMYRKWSFPLVCASFPINLCLVLKFCFLFDFFQLSLLCLFDPQMPSYFFSKARPLFLSFANPFWNATSPHMVFSLPPSSIQCALFSVVSLLFFSPLSGNAELFSAHRKALILDLSLKWAFTCTVTTAVQKTLASTVCMKTATTVFFNFPV